jgi:hypothetical protein
MYVIIVLLISGLARANAAMKTTTQFLTPATVSQVTLDASHAQVIVDGSFPSLCYGEPSAMLIQNQNDPSVLVLHLSSPTPEDKCIDKIKYFNTDVSLVKLAELSQVSIDPHMTYTLKVNGNVFTASIPGSELLIK